MSKGTVLIVGSNADKLELQAGKVVSTGIYLNETVVPARTVVDAGYHIVLGTPRGTKPVLDSRSIEASHFGGSEPALQEALAFFETFPAMQAPSSLRSLIEGGMDRFVGLFVPGGHAPVTDLIRDPDLGELLRHFHGASQPTALLCHGPIAVISAMPDAAAFCAAMETGAIERAKAVAKGWQYAGYKMTIFSNEEEQIVEEQIFHGKLKFHVGDALQAAGGILTSNQHPFEPNVTQDRELITGQNPRSDHAIADALVKALDRQTAKTGRA